MRLRLTPQKRCLTLGYLAVKVIDLTLIVDVTLINMEIDGEQNFQQAHWHVRQCKNSEKGREWNVSSV